MYSNVVESPINNSLNRDDGIMFLLSLVTLQRVKNPEETGQLLRYHYRSSTRSTMI